MQCKNSVTTSVTKVHTEPLLDYFTMGVRLLRFNWKKKRKKRHSFRTLTETEQLI